jgi:protoheme IX farnesyltransferase
VLTLGLATNWVAAAILAASILFYVLIYTVWLKRRTPQNIVIGGAAGAFPPMIGWAAATGDLSLLPVLLFSIIFLWTPPHFWALALFVKTDYANAGVPMLPVVAGEKVTRRHVLIYTLPMVACALAPWALGLMGAIYGITALVLNAVFLVMAAHVAFRQTGVDDPMRAEKALFAFSILYLFVLFAAVAADAMVHA